MADPTNTPTNEEAKPQGQDPNRLGAPVHDAPETHVGDDYGLSIDIGGGDHNPNPQVDHGSAGSSTEVGDGTVILEDGGEGDGLEPHEREAAAADAPKAFDLPAYDAAKPEVEAAYSGRFMNAAGAPDIAKFSEVWTPKLDAAGNVVGGDLPEDAYKFLEAKGFDRATIKAIEAGQIAAAGTTNTRTFAMAGGEANYRAAQAWAKEHWTDEEKKVFNADREAGGVREKNAISNLINGFKEANPPARRASPLRSVGDSASGEGSGGAPKVEPYKTYGEWQADVRKAQKEIKTQAGRDLLQLSRARLRVSSFGGPRNS